MLKQQDKEAITEVMDILRHMKQQDVDKISPSFMQYLKDNVSTTYVPNLDHTCAIDKMQLRKQTRIILAIIYRKFWCGQENKKNFDRILNENERDYQEEMRKKYNPDDVFKNKKMQDSKGTQSNLQLIEYKQTMISKIINKIKRLFYKQ